jgi:hypothetical protein
MLSACEFRSEVEAFVFQQDVICSVALEGCRDFKAHGVQTEMRQRCDVLGRSCYAQSFA